ncbi:MAG: SusC/RagA family TonB-linked outer membrane protein [Salinibacter sp.]
MQYRSSIITLVLLGLTLCVGTVHAQAQEISGTVTSADNNSPLPGANVSVPGTTIGTATNAQGKYTLSVPSDADSLRFSFVGFRDQTVPIAGRSTINVALVPAAKKIQELVVVGYGQQQERDVTGVVSKVSSEDFNKGSVVSPEQLISGKIAGVNITPSSGAPGAGSQIRIRGASSVNADSEPLFVVDGVPISGEGSQASRNPLNFLNPSNIKNVTVLKDASATAIYGARGANGVILIETKGGGEKKGGRVSYNGSVSTSVVTDRVDVLGADEFRRVVREQAPSQVSELGDASTDWQDAVDRNAFTQEHSLSFSRGYEDSSIRLSLGYLDKEGILQTSSMSRVSASLKYNQKFFDDQLSIRTSLRGSKRRNQFQPGLVGSSASFDPTQPIRDPGSPFGGFYEWSQTNAENNPVASYILTENHGETYRSIGNVEAEYKIPGLEGLRARLKLGYDVREGEREFFAPTFLKSQAEAENPGQVGRSNFSRLNTLLDAFLSYDQTFESIRSQFEATAGYSYQEFHEEYPEFTARGLNSNFLGPNSTDPVTDTENTTTFVAEIPSRLISGFGRFNYTFMDRYLLTFTIRRDGSSRFGPENRWGTFPSGALAWRVHKEPFVEDLDFLSTLKIRGSWGVTGNQEIGDFRWAPFWQPGGPQAQVQFGDNFVSTIRPSAADQTIKWEETTSYNIGFDYGLFGERVTGSVEYYYKKTEDMLFQVTVPAGSNLSDRVLTNIGSMENEGIEFSVDARVVNTSDFSYSAQFNASTNRNKILNVARASEGFATGGISGGVGNTIQINQEGEPINSFYVYRHKETKNGKPRTDGVDYNGDGVVNGVDMYVDQNGDGQINSADLVVGESPQPDWTFGHTSRMTYQGFDLSFTVRAQIGNYVYNNVASNYGHYSRLTNFAPSNLHTSVKTTKFSKPQYFSDYYVEDASFLRMDNISLGYTLNAIPGVKRLRIYGTVENVFVLTGYSGPDPEVIGIDNNLYPRSRTFTAGLNVQL